jgi:hypothetical protein
MASADSSRTSGPTRRLAAAIGGLLVMTANPAAEYTFKADASAGGQYNTNLFLTPLRHNEVWGAQFGLNAQFSAAQEIWKVEGGARLQENIYSGERGLDSFNQYGTLKGYYLPDERTQWALRGDYNHDTTLTSLFENNDLVFTQVRRDSQIVNPSWSRKLAENTTLRLDYQFQNTHYDNRENTRFADSVTHLGAAYLEHDASARLKLTGSASYTSYTTPGSTVLLPATLQGVDGILAVASNDTTVDYANLMAGFRYELSESFTVGLAGGGQYSTSKSSSESAFLAGNGRFVAFPAERISEDSLSYLLSADVVKRFDLDELGFNYNRSITPNIYGTLIEDNRFTFTATHKFTPLLNASLRVVYSDRTAADQLSISFNRQFLRAEANVNWNWTENLALDASYQYSQQEFPTTSAVPNSHAVFVTVRYHWDRLRY